MRLGGLRLMARRYWMVPERHHLGGVNAPLGKCDGGCALLRRRPPRQIRSRFSSVGSPSEVEPQARKARSEAEPSEVEPQARKARSEAEPSEVEQQETLR